MRRASGSARSLPIATTPRSGPIARIANAHRHPSARTASGISQIENSVIEKPMHVCVVSAVPT